MDSNSQYPYEDNPEGRKPVPLPPTPGALEARRRLLLQSGMTPEEVDHVLRSGRAAEAASKAVSLAGVRRRIGTGGPVDPAMAEWVETFIKALDADLIRPFDF